MFNISIIWGLIILFILQPGIAHDGAEAGAKLFVHALLPYLLPYIILTQWLVKLSAGDKKTSIWRKFIKVYILGSFGGFPVGAVTVSEMKKNGQLSTKQSELLIAACHAPGPMFIIGFVGLELLGDLSAGWKMLIAIHLVNALFFILLLVLQSKSLEDPSYLAQPIAKPKQFPLLESIKDSTNIMLLVATTVIFFSSLGTVLAHSIASTFTVDTGILTTTALSIFEMTTGAQSAAVHFNGYSFLPYLLALIVSLNGLSIHMQVMIIAKGANISLKTYVFGRLWSITLVPILYFLLY